MKSYHKNPRRITPKQLEQLKANIQELGDLSGIVHDLNTDEIISGNQRSKVIDINKCEVVITEKYDTPNQQGTVAWGYVIFEGQKMNYRQVRWDDRQREKACITANSLGGEFDYSILTTRFDTELIKDWGILDVENHRILDMDGFFSEETKRRLLLDVRASHDAFLRKVLHCLYPKQRRPNTWYLENRPCRRLLRSKIADTRKAGNEHRGNAGRCS